MELSDFRSFEQLATTLHFGQAARLLGVSPSALTRRIQAMEEELGHELLLRDQRSVELTEAGRRFLDFARTQLDQYEQLLAELRQEQESPSGQLDLACTVTACHSVLPRLLASFREHYPRITPRLVTQDAERSLELLEQGAVDVAVIPTKPDAPPELEHIHLGHTPLTLIRPADPGALTESLAANPPDFARLPFVAQVAGLERSRLLTWLDELGVQPRIVAEVRGNEGIIAMVSLGSGLALVPQLVLDSSPLRDRVVAMDCHGPRAGYDVSLCAKSRALRRHIVKLFWQLAKQTAGAAPTLSRA